MMWNGFRVGAGLVLAALLPAMGAAQTNRAGQGTDRHKWWLSERVQQEVGITAEQAKTLEAVFQTVLPDLRAHKAELDRFEGEVSDLVAMATATEAQVTEAVARTEAARAALYRTRTLMLYRMYRVLSAEQRVKLQGFQKRLDSTRTSRRDQESARPPR